MGIPTADRGGLARTWTSDAGRESRKSTPKVKIAQLQAAKELGLKSDRQICNLMKRYREGSYSIKALLHRRKDT